jgi:Domain of unknown function (DUF4112)
MHSWASLTAKMNKLDSTSKMQKGNMRASPIIPEIISNKVSPTRPYSASTLRDDLAVAESLADWLDAKFEIPGLGIRFGLDAILGIVPGFGDALTSLASLYILAAATRHNVPRITQARMAANIAVDWLMGSIPLLGDLFDVAWKANKMNVALLKRHVESTTVERRRHQRHDWLFLAFLVFLLLIVLASALTVASLAIAGIFRFFSG